MTTATANAHLIVLAEMLRLIVRDDLGGAADLIAAALMDNL